MIEYRPRSPSRDDITLSRLIPSEGWPVVVDDSLIARPQSLDTGSPIAALGGAVRPAGRGADARLARLADRSGGRPAHRDPRLRDAGAGRAEQRAAGGCF